MTPELWVLHHSYTRSKLLWFLKFGGGQGGRESRGQDLGAPMTAFSGPVALAALAYPSTWPPSPAST